MRRSSDPIELEKMMGERAGAGSMQY